MRNPKVNPGSTLTSESNRKKGPAKGLEKEGPIVRRKTRECGAQKPKEGSVSRRRKYADNCAESN